MSSTSEQDVTEPAKFSRWRGYRTLLSQNFVEAAAKDAVVDDETAESLGLERLINDIAGGARTSTGKLVTKISLQNPHFHPAIIEEKQRALHELRNNDEVRNGVAEFLDVVAKEEDKIVTYVGEDNDLWYKLDSATYAIRTIARSAESLPVADSPFLERPLSVVRSLHNSPVHHFAEGPIHRGKTSGRLYGQKELDDVKESHTRFGFDSDLYVAARVAPSIIGGVIGFGLGIYGMATNALPAELIGALLVVGGTVDFAAGVWSHRHALKTRKARYWNPAQQRVAEISPFFDEIGVLDELMAYDKFGQSLPVSTLPTITDDKSHSFNAKGLVHPIISRYIENYVPNDISLAEFDIQLGMRDRLTIVTGPNSGGKSALASAIALTQVLGQAGCYVPAQRASMSFADRIIYQSGTNQPHIDGEGGLGGQLTVSRDNFIQATPRTLYIVDDLMDATSHIGKQILTTQHIAGMLRKGTDIVYITHDSDMAKMFQNHNVGQYLQVEFDGDKATHRIVEGISTDSHPEIVARRIGFDEQAITEHLIEQGLMKPNESLMDLSGFARPKPDLAYLPSATINSQ